MGSITGILPIHNESYYLRYSLPSLRQIPFSELVCILDRCVDSSEHLIRTYLPHAKILYKEEQTWTHTRAGETLSRGIEEATSPLIFVLNADIILPINILSVIEKVMRDRRVGSVFFGFRQFDSALRKRIHLEYINLLKKVTDRWSPYKDQFTTGIYCFRRELAEVRDVYAEYDDLQQQIRERGYVACYYPTNDIIHLRSGVVDRGRQMWHGQVRAKMHEPLPKTLLHSVINLKFWTLLTYLRCKLGE